MAFFKHNFFAKRPWTAALACLLLALAAGGCHDPSTELPSGAKLVRAFSPPQDAPLAPGVTADGEAWRIDARGPNPTGIFEVPAGLLCADCQIFFRAKLKSRDLSGHVFLELVARLGYDQDFFHRDLIHTAHGTQGWTQAQASCFVAPGPKARGLLLNVVPQGTGTVWIKDVEVYTAPTVITPD